MSHRTRLIGGIWLLLLSVYVIAGLRMVVFHGDEAMQIYMSNDYATAFIYHEPEQLAAGPPYFIDEDNWLRIMNGSVNRYAIGVAWHLRGLTTGNLPPRPGWDWGLDYDTNIATDHRPADALLYAGRVPSTLFLVVSVWVMFALGWQVGGRLTAFVASGLYALHPVILLNGRRAMMEGSLLCFGLLALLVAAIISRRSAQAQRVSWQWWLALTLACGLAPVSKHTGAVFAAGAFGWILFGEVVRRDWRRLLRTTLTLTVSGVGVLVLFVALSPALWNTPIPRTLDLLEIRAGLIDIQVNADPDAPTTLNNRLIGIITQPFIVTPQFYEVAGWADFDPITAEIARYTRHPLSGYRTGWLLGVPLTLLAGSGLLVTLNPRLQPRTAHPFAAGVVIAILPTLAMLLVNPLPWQRYYLPLLPFAALLAALGIATLVSRIRSENTTKQDNQALASPLHVDDTN